MAHHGHRPPCQRVPHEWRTLPRRTLPVTDSSFASLPEHPPATRPFRSGRSVLRTRRSCVVLYWNRSTWWLTPASIIAACTTNLSPFVRKNQNGLNSVLRQLCNDLQANPLYFGWHRIGILLLCLAD